jgi:hypothetical protein
MHTLPPGKDWLWRMLIAATEAARCRRTVRVASVEMALSLSPLGSLSLSKLPYTPHKTNVGGI